MSQENSNATGDEAACGSSDCCEAAVRQDVTAMHQLVHSRYGLPPAQTCISGHSNWLSWSDCPCVVCTCGNPVVYQGPRMVRLLALCITLLVLAACFHILLWGISGRWTSSLACLTTRPVLARWGTVRCPWLGRKVAAQMDMCIHTHPCPPSLGPATPR